MASTTPKAPCLTCGKGTGLFKCEGCTQTFCTKHVVEHRQTLHHQLDEIIVEHDTLQQTINENKDQSHPLIDHINEWEQSSIKKIEQVAKETRQKVVELANMHTKTISEELNVLTERLKKAREEDDFFETDLNNWISTLNKLKEELTNNPTSSNIKEDLSAPFIYQLKLVTASPEYNDKSMIKRRQNETKMIASDDIFEFCLGGAKIEDNGRLIVHDKDNYAVEVRGKVDYSSGTHQFRLQIEKCSFKTWIFMGIISKSTQMAKNSYESPSAYGWADYNDFFLDGVRQNDQKTGQFSNTVENDIITLVLDCTNRTISYTNERIQKSEQLNVDVKKCSFPWKLHVNLFGENDQVRLLSVKSTL